MPLRWSSVPGVQSLDQDRLKSILRDLKQELEGHTLEFAITFEQNYGYESDDEYATGVREYRTVNATLYYLFECENEFGCGH